LSLLATAVDTSRVRELPLAAHIARFCLALRIGDIPVEVQQKVAACLLDFVGCCLRARDIASVRQARQWAEKFWTLPEATILGSPLHAAASEVAFANGVAGHSLIREDMHVASSSHIGVVVLPALLALGEAQAASGAQFVTAVVAGYEVMARLGMALAREEFVRSFRPTGIIGPFGAAAGCISLAGLEQGEAVNALGIAGNLFCGLNEWSWSGGTEIYMHAGVAARNALFAINLARGGMIASSTILEGPAGMLNAFGAPESSAEALVEGLGTSNFQVMNVFHKPAPACNFVQTATQAAMRLVQRFRIDANRIVAVKIGSFPEAVSYPGCNFSGPFRTVEQAKMSLQFTVASALVHGKLDQESFETLDDPRVLRLVAATQLAIDPQFAAAFPAKQGSEITLTLDDAKVVRERQPALESLSPDEVRARFAEDASGLFDSARIRAIQSAADELPKLRDVREFTALLSLERESRA
jgi:2-methylcitrate dehydratase PrpD